MTYIGLLNLLNSTAVLCGVHYTPCPGKNGPPKQTAVKCTVYNTIQWHLHSII